jgi:hypothetical protein
MTPTSGMKIEAQRIHTLAANLYLVSISVMFVWHSDGGEKYFNFEEANVLEGGVLRSAADAGAIELPFRHMFFLNENRDGWATKMRPTDILSLSYFPTKSHIGKCSVCVC